MKVQTTKNVEHVSVVNLLLYGRSGIGKTCALAWCPSPIILSAENGLMSLKSKDIPFVEITSIQSLRETFVWLTKSKEGEQYQTICIDSISEVCDLAFNDCKQRIGNDPVKLYPELRSTVQPLLAAFKSLPRHFIATAHETTKQLGDDQLTVPSVIGNKLADYLPYVFDVVLHYTLDGDNERIVYTNADRGSVAKDRTGLLTAEITDITDKFLVDVLEQLTGVKNG